jgi:hypothetical protein
VRPVEPAVRIGLTLGQIVEGRVLEVQGRRATIDIGGRPIAAETQTALAPGDQVTLRVRDASGDVVRMQVLERTSPGALRTLSGAELQATLRALGLEPSPVLQGLARTFIALGVPLDAQVLTDLAARLAQLGQPSEANLRAAALLQQLGLPVTAATLELARAYLQGDGPLGRAVRAANARAERLAAALRGRGDATALREALAQFGALVEGLALFDGDEGPLAERLARRTADLAVPPEAKLARWGGADAPSFGRDLRLALERLLAEVDAFLSMRPGGAAQREAAALRAALGQLADELAFQQLMNAGQPPPAVEAGRVYIWQLPWAHEPGWESVRIKVQRDPGGRRLDPAARPVHLRFEFDLAGLGALAADVVVHRERIGCHFSSADEATVQLLAAHSGELVAALKALGYAQPDVRSLRVAAPVEPASGPPPEPRRVDAVV